MGGLVDGLCFPAVMVGFKYDASSSSSSLASGSVKPLLVSITNTTA